MAPFVRITFKLDIISYQSASLTAYKKTILVGFTIFPGVIYFKRKRAQFGDAASGLEERIHDSTRVQVLEVRVRLAGAHEDDRLASYVGHGNSRSHLHTTPNS